MDFKIIIYLINLDGSDERLETATTCLSHQGIDFRRISAFDGRKIDPVGYPEYDEVKALSYMGRKLAGGEIGCYFSHVNCAKTFLESDADYAVILEDDMIPTENLMSKIEQMLEKLRDQTWFLINIGALKRKIFTPLFNIENHQISKAHYFPMTTTGVIWNRSGAQAFLENAYPIYAPVDNFFRHWLTSNNMGLSVYPPLVWASDAKSDIDHNTKRKYSGRASNYGVLKQKRLWQDKLIATKNKLLG